MSATFTPGPWEVVASEHPDNANRWLEIVDSGYGNIIGEVFNDEAEDEPCITHEIANANARLIAAAPELYALVKAIDAMWSDDGDGGRADPIDARSEKVREIWSQMRAALAKARGEKVPA